METIRYNQDGKKTGTLELPEPLFGVSYNADLVHQVVVSMESNARSPIAHAKDRSEVRGGGKKPWKQKGTGRARHGSIRSPIWVGGGVAHGPRKERNFSKKINQKMRAKALAVVLSGKFKDGEVLFIDTVSFTEPKTKVAQHILRNLSGIEAIDSLGGRNGRRVLVVVPARDEMLEKSFENIPRVLVEEARNINSALLLKHKYVLFINPDATLDILRHRVVVSNNK